jgi:hypothetical protein
MNWHTLYPIALFIHIVGVLSLFIAMGLQWVALYRLRQAQTLAQVRSWLGLLAINRRLSLPSTVLIVGAGAYMMATAWGWNTPWILASLGAIVIMMVLGMGVTARRLNAAAQTAAFAGGLSPDLRRRIHDPLVWIAVQVGGATALGVVFLMTTKPDLGGSLLALAMAMLVGAAVGWLTNLPGRRIEGTEVERAAPVVGEHAH